MQSCDSKKQDKKVSFQEDILDDISNRKSVLDEDLRSQNRSPIKR